MGTYNVNYNRLGIMNVTYSDLLGTVSVPYLDPKTQILEPGMILHFRSRETLSFQSPGSDPCYLALGIVDVFNARRHHFLFLWLLPCHVVFSGGT
jgi:hypothetical protein